MATHRNATELTRLTLVLLYSLHLGLTPHSAAAQTPKQSARLPRASATSPRANEPPELTGPQKAVEPVTATVGVYTTSKALQEARPENPATLGPAIRDLTSAIQQQPDNPDLYLLRATFSCYAGADPAPLVDDVTRSIELLKGFHHALYSSPRQHYAFKAKLEVRLRQFQDAIRDLDAATREDYTTASKVFDDVELQASASSCAWTLADLEQLERASPADFRPVLFQGLYRDFLLSFQSEADPKLAVEAYQRAARLNASSPLPPFLLGLHTVDRVGGLFSKASAECLDWILPRTPACLALDEIRWEGVRYLTQAIALDPSFGPAVELRASALYSLKEFRQAIRDYDKALGLPPRDSARRGLYNDRGLAKFGAGQYEEAVLDFTRAIALGCEGDNSCHTYEHRADAYLKLGSFQRAIADIGAEIRRTLSSAVFLMNIGQFRRLYPEYDGLSDQVLCEKVRAVFFPSMSYAVFSKQFLIEAKGPPTFVLSDLFLKRGDAYAHLGLVKQANAEYDRVSRVFPDLARFAFVERNGQRVRKPPE